MSSPFLGEIKLMPWNFNPRGWALCSGQILSIAQNTALFSLLGTMYGGNGTTTFGLPDLRGRVPMHRDQAGLYPQGTLEGQESVTILTSNMPAHTHPLNAYAGAATTQDPNSHYLAIPDARSGPAIYDTAAGVTLAATALSSAGGNLPYANMAPFLCLNFCIATNGIFPARN